MESSFWFDMLLLGQSIVHVWGCQVIVLKDMFSLKIIFFILTNSVDPDGNGAVTVC